NVLDRPDPFLISANSVEKIRNQQPVHDEPSLVTRANRDLVQLSCEIVDRVEDGRIGRNGSYDFHKLHQWHRIEEVQSYETLGSFGCGQQFGDRDGGRVRRKNRFLLHYL